MWKLLQEPFHLSDWWPGYTAIRPDRRGLQNGARWTVVRSSTPGLLRRPGGEGVITITDVAEGSGFAWHDVQQHFDAHIAVAAAANGSHATLVVEAPPWRLFAEGLRRLPDQALARLHALCQTAAGL